jgi:transcriptional regulator with XRE-family HTH domain
MTFGMFIRAERLRLGLGQDAFARRAFMGRTHVSLLERDKRNPRLDTLVWIARALDLTPAQLVAGWWHTCDEGTLGG